MEDEMFNELVESVREGGRILKAGRTAFPRAEERIRPILDAYLSEVRKITQDDYYPPKPYYQTWVAGARELVEVLTGDAGDFMAWAFPKFMHTFPDSRPHSPKSLLYLVERYKPNALHNWDSVLCSECFQSPCVCEEE